MSEQPITDPLAAWRALRDRLLGGSTHEHAWQVVDTWKPDVQRPVHPRMQGSVPSTYVLIVCEQCHLPQTIELEGIWTTEQVKARAEA